ncbi:MAG TPA: hypothetical protein VJ305_16275, partial [Streptosporangiaceae bacterium]|nr:hypothetical protein [Streptosporangiaceae bacterium]
MFENWSEFEVDLSSVRRAVGGGCFVRGSQSSWRQAVYDIDWDPIAAVLCGTVHGKNGTRYAPEAEFVSGARPALFARGRCACVAGGACQHVVALICAALAASGIDLAAAVPAPRPAGSCDRPPSRRGPAADARPTVLVAIEVKLAIPRTHSPRLVSRLVERVPGGDWVHGNLTWGSLETAGRRDTYLAPQVELLRELCALYQAGGQNICGRERLLDLSAVDD